MPAGLRAGHTAPRLRRGKCNCDEKYASLKRPTDKLKQGFRRLKLGDPSDGCFRTRLQNRWMIFGPQRMNDQFSA
jgi:hypothetical protein